MYYISSFYNDNNSLLPEGILRLNPLICMRCSNYSDKHHWGCTYACVYISTETHIYTHIFKSVYLLLTGIYNNDMNTQILCISSALFSPTAWSSRYVCYSLGCITFVTVITMLRCQRLCLCRNAGALHSVVHSLDSWDISTGTGTELIKALFQPAHQPTQVLSCLFSHVHRDVRCQCRSRACFSMRRVLDQEVGKLSKALIFYCSLHVSDLYEPYTLYKYWSQKTFTI